MASKVNTKFVIGLSVALAVVGAGAATAAYMLVVKSAGALIEAGDKQAAANNFKKAAELYAKGVNKEQTNVEYLRKWRTAVMKVAPDSQVKFDQMFQADLIASTRQIAVRAATDVQAHRDYLDLSSALSQFQVTKDSQERIITETNDALRFFANASPEQMAKAEVLRRYRGMALVRQYELDPQLAPEKVEQAKADLEAALSIDPADNESLDALVAWYTTTAQGNIRAQEMDKAKATLDQAIEACTAAAAKNPGGPVPLLHRARMTIGRTFLDMSRTATEAENEKFREAAVKRAKPDLEEASRLAEKADPATLSRSFFERLRLLEQDTDPEARLPRTVAALKRVLEARPDDAELLFFSATIEAERGNYDGAIASADKIVALPRPTVTLAGATVNNYKRIAEVQRALWAFKGWEAAANNEDRAKAAARLKGMYDALATTLDPNNPGFLLVKAHQLFVEENYTQAARILAPMSAAGSPNRTFDVLWLDARVSMAQNRPGDARERIEELLQIQPFNAQLYVMLADAAQRSGSAEAAIKSLEFALSRVKTGPETANVREFLTTRINALRGIAGQGDKTNDPVLVELSRISRLATEGNRKRDETLALQATELRKALETFKGDLRVVETLGLVLITKGDRDGAIKVYKDALAANPDNNALKTAIATMEAKSPLDARLAAIDLSQSEAHEKVAARYTTFVQFGETEKAKAELKKLAELKPDAPSTVELLFIDAIGEKRWNDAQALTNKATEKNLDEFQGATYKARLLAAQDNRKGALEVIKPITTAGGASPEIWRLQGRIELEMGRTPEAITSFTRASDSRPTDVQAAKDLVRALLASGRGTDALGRCRAMERFAMNDRDFVDTFIDLEARFGGSEGLAKAINLREQLVSSSPNDRPNNGGLALLYIQARNFDRAKPLIDALKAEKDDLDAAQLLAAWHANQNDPQNAKKAFEDYITRQGDKLKDARAHLALAQFQGEQNDVDGMLATLEKARPLQDTKAMDVDRALAEILIRLRRDEAGIAACRRLVEAPGLDDAGKLPFRIAIIEALLRQDKAADAEKELAALASIRTTDYRVMLLEADAKRRAGDNRKAMEILNEGVTRFRDSPMLYLRRAELSMLKKEGYPDARADLDKAIALEPSNAMLYRARATLNSRDDREDDAIADLRQALKANPNQQEVRQFLLATLIRRDRDDEAAQLAREIIGQSGGNVQAMMEAAVSFARAGKWPRAIGFYEDALKVQQSPMIANLYLDALMNVKPTPELAKAEGVLRDFGASVDKDVGLLMARARLLHMRNNTQAAQQSAVQAARLADPKNPDQISAWFQTLISFVPDSKQQLAYIDALERTRFVPAWVSFFRATIRYGETATREQGLNEFKALNVDATPVEVRVLALRALNNSFIIEKRYQEAVEIAQQGLKLLPKDAGFANNLAFILAKHLDRVQDAIEPARIAVEAAPNSPEALDTFGFVMLRAGKPEEARPKLEQAAQFVNINPDTRVLILTHLAEACIGTKDIPAAKRAIAQADEAVAANPEGVSPETKADLEAVRSKAR